MFFFPELREGLSKGKEELGGKHKRIRDAGRVCGESVGWFLPLYLSLCKVMKVNKGKVFGLTVCRINLLTSERGWLLVCLFRDFCSVVCMCFERRFAQLVSFKLRDLPGVVFRAGILTIQACLCLVVRRCEVNV